jgi:hypothetical protein
LFSITDYYLESLLTAYEATANRKYIEAFTDSGAWVLSLVRTITVLNVPDPSAPGKTGPLASVTGWPTVLASFGVPVAIPTSSGQVALYVQSLDTTSGLGAAYFVVNQGSDSSLTLEWHSLGRILKTDTVQLTPPVSSSALGPFVTSAETMSQIFTQLESIASQPLINTPDMLSPGRIIPTGIDLPAPGQYAISTPLQTIWHEQTGGIRSRKSTPGSQTKAY